MHRARRCPTAASEPRPRNLADLYDLVPVDWADARRTLETALLHWAMPAFEGDSGATFRSHARPVPVVPSSAFKGYRFAPEIVVLAVRWYLRFGLSYRDIEELMVERGIEVDHVTAYRWVQRFTPLLVDGAGRCRHGVGGRWCLDETYVKVAGRWRYVYRAIDQYGQLIAVYASAPTVRCMTRSGTRRRDGLAVPSR